MSGMHPQFMLSKRFPVHTAIELQDLTTLASLLSQERDARFHFERKLTDNEVSVLHQACCARTQSSKVWSDIVKVCLNLGAPVNEPDCIGQTPLFYAVTHCQAKELVPLLLTAGAYVNHPRWSDGWTVLHVAAMVGAKEVSCMLLQAGANTTLQDQQGVTAAQLAIKYGYKCIAETIKKSPKNLFKEEVALTKKIETIPQPLQIHNNTNGVHLNGFTKTKDECLDGMSEEVAWAMKMKKEQEEAKRKAEEQKKVKESDNVLKENGDQKTKKKTPEERMREWKAQKEEERKQKENPQLSQADQLVNIAEVMERKRQRRLDARKKMTDKERIEKEQKALRDAMHDEIIWALELKKDMADQCGQTDEAEKYAKLIKEEEEKKDGTWEKRIKQAEKEKEEKKKQEELAKEREKQLAIQKEEEQKRAIEHAAKMREQQKKMEEEMQRRKEQEAFDRLPKWKKDKILREKREAEEKIEKEIREKEEQIIKKKQEEELKIKQEKQAEEEKILELKRKEEEKALQEKMIEEENQRRIKEMKEKEVEEENQRNKERLLKEEREKIELLKKKEEEERLEAERQNAIRLEEERKRAEEDAMRIEKEKQIAETIRKEEEKKRIQEQIKKQEEEEKRLEEKRRNQERERIEREEALKLETERKFEEEKRKAEEREQKQRKEDTQLLKRVEERLRKKQEADELKRKEEILLQEEKQKVKEEARRLKEEQIQQQIAREKEEEINKQREDAIKLAEEVRKREETNKRNAERQRLAEEKILQEEKDQQLKLKKEEEDKLYLQKVEERIKKRAEETKKLQEKKAKEKEDALQKEKAKAEEQRLLVEKQKAEEQALLMEEQKRLQEAKRIAEEEMKRHLERVEARRKRRADEEYLRNEEFKKIREEKIKGQEREGTIIEKDILIEEDENKVQNETEMILEQKKDKVESEKNTDQQLKDYSEKNHIKEEYATQEFPMENKIQCLNLSENNLENLNRQEEDNSYKSFNFPDDLQNEDKIIPKENSNHKEGEEEWGEEYEWEWEEDDAVIENCVTEDQKEGSDNIENSVYSKSNEISSNAGMLSSSIQESCNEILDELGDKKEEQMSYEEKINTMEESDFNIDRGLDDDPENVQNDDKSEYNARVTEDISGIHLKISENKENIESPINRSSESCLESEKPLEVEKHQKSHSEKVEMLDPESNDKKEHESVHQILHQIKMENVSLTINDGGKEEIREKKEWEVEKDRLLEIMRLAQEKIEKARQEKENREKIKQIDQEAQEEEVNNKHNTDTGYTYKEGQDIVTDSDKETYFSKEKNVHHEEETDSLYELHKIDDRKEDPSYTNESLPLSEKVGVPSEHEHLLEDDTKTCDGEQMENTTESQFILGSSAAADLDSTLSYTNNNDNCALDKETMVETKETLNDTRKDALETNIESHTTTQIDILQEASNNKTQNCDSDQHLEIKFGRNDSPSPSLVGKRNNITETDKSEYEALNEASIEESLDMEGNSLLEVSEKKELNESNDNHEVEMKKPTAPQRKGGKKERESCNSEADLVNNTYSSKQNSNTLVTETIYMDSPLLSSINAESTSTSDAAVDLVDYVENPSTNKDVYQTPLDDIVNLEPVETNFMSKLGSNEKCEIERKKIIEEEKNQLEKLMLMVQEKIKDHKTGARTLPTELTDQEPSPVSSDSKETSPTNITVHASRLAENPIEPGINIPNTPKRKKELDINSQNFNSDALETKTIEKDVSNLTKIGAESCIEHGKSEVIELCDSKDTNDEYFMEDNDSAEKPTVPARKKEVNQNKIEQITHELKEVETQYVIPDLALNEKKEEERKKAAEEEKNQLQKLMMMVQEKINAARNKK